MVYQVVGFSGGIDSQATALWVRQRFPAEEIRLINSDAGGNEHPITAAHIEWYSANVFPVITVSALIKDLGNRATKEEYAAKARRDEYEEDDLLTFDRLAYINGRFPGRKAQFCTEILKLAPQRRWADEHVYGKGHDMERYVGLRQDESDKRAATPERIWDTYFDCFVNYPLRLWDKEQTFAYCLDAGEQVNPLYTMGFSRVGCAPCINASKEDIRLWAAHSPEMIDKIRGWEKAVGKTFFPPIIPNTDYNKAINTWRDDWCETVVVDGKKKLQRKPGAPPKPSAALNWIDDVVAWARTTRGGSQFELPMLEAEVASGSCISKYKLCE